MTPDNVISVANEMLWLSFLLSMPLLLTALVVGVFVSLLQTVTGIQEMTLTFVPKIMATLLVLAIVFPWMKSVLVDYTATILLAMGNG